MNPEDFVYNQIFKGALAKGASERKSQIHAQLGMEDFKKNKIAKKVSHMIELRIKLAVTDSKKGR